MRTAETGATSFVLPSVAMIGLCATVDFEDNRSGAASPAWL